MNPIILAAAEAPAPDYTPALIGLGGVILGGIIQVIATRRNEVERQVKNVREESAQLAAAAADYSAVMAQLVRVLNPVKEKFLAEQEKNPNTELSAFIDEDYWRRLGDEFMGNFAKAFNLSLSIAAGKDHRVADQAMKVHHVCTDAHNEAAPVLTGEGDMTAERAEELRKEINLEASVLLTMVGPRKIERDNPTGGRRPQAGGTGLFADDMHCVGDAVSDV